MLGSFDVTPYALAGTALFAIGCTLWMIWEVRRAPLIEDDELVWDRPTRRDRQVSRYAAEQTAVIDFLYAIPHEGEWPSWPTDREAA